MNSERALLLAALLAVPAGAAERVVVNMEDSLTGAGLIIAREKGFFKELGLDVEFRALAQGGPAQKMRALAGGSLDVVRTHLHSGLVDEAARSGTRLVADGGRWVKGRPRESYLVMRRGLAARGYKDLRGRTVALPGSPGTVLGLEILRGLAATGLGEQDITASDARQRLRPALLASKRIDAATLWEPLAGQCVKRGIGAVFAGTDVAPSSEQALGLFFSRKFMERHEVAERFLAGYLRGLEAYRTMPAEESRLLLGKSLGVAVDARQMESVNFGPDGAADAGSLSRLADEWLRLGLVKSAVAVKEFYDPSFLVGARRILAAR